MDSVDPNYLPQWLGKKMTLSSRELLTSIPSPLLDEVSNQDACDSVQSPVDRAWLLVFCYPPAEKWPPCLSEQAVLAQMPSVLHAGSRQSVTKCWTREIKTPKGFGAFVSCTSSQPINLALWKLLLSWVSEFLCITPSRNNMAINPWRFTS